MRASQILLLAMLAPTAAFAQSLAEVQTDSLIASTKIVVVSNGTGAKVSPTIRRQIETFYYDQFRHSQDPDAPYFMFMSKDEQMMMGIGGTVRMRSWYDWDGAMPSNGFSPILIPATPNPLSRNHLGTTPAGTCLYFRLLGRSGVLGDYQAYIEANFNGYQSRDFHLKKAYVTVGKLTVGYASSTFSDPAAVPYTVDASGPNNKLSHTTVLVRYMPHLTKHITAAISVENPDTYISEADSMAKAAESYIPDFATFLQYNWGRNQHVRIAAILRSLPYRDIATATSHNDIGWGIQASSISHPTAAITIYATANYGAGYAGLGGDLLAGAYDLIDNPNAEGQLYAPRSMGWSAAVQYNFKRNLFATVIASEARLLPQHQINADEYKYGLLGAINIFWNPTPRIQLGAELDLGKRQDFSKAGRYARRIGLMAQLSF